MEIVHLHCHSSYSLLEGTATPQALVSRARQLHMPALALTDRGNLYGAVTFYSHAQKAGIKPLLGMVIDLDDGYSLTLLARNLDGYRNLCHLSTILRLKADTGALPPAGFDEGEEGEEDDEGYDGEILPWDPGLWGIPVFGFTDRPSPLRHLSKFQVKDVRLQRGLLLSGRYARGLVALSGGQHGLINSLVMQGKTEQAARAAGTLVAAFGEGNLFIELTALNERDTGALPVLADLANRLGIPVVATNDVLYVDADDASTAMALAVARKGRGAFREPPLQVVEGRLQAHPDLQEEVGTERHFKTTEQMAELFHAYPQALANTHYIAEQCTVELPMGKPLFPGVGLEGDTPYSKLWKLAFDGATRRYRPLTEAVIARLKHELEIIEALGFSTYFLVIQDIVDFAHSQDIPIMARGSAANSLVGYVLGITQVDPLQNDLLFERFLSASRAEHELPDVDLDLCWRRRDEVLHYVYERYGREHVANVGTYITFRLRSGWREMAKALGIAPQRVSYVASRLPDLSSADDILDGNEEMPELTEAVELVGNAREAEHGTEEPSSRSRQLRQPRFRDDTERVAFELSQAIEGLPKHCGMHCAAVVIAPGPIASLVPLQRAARDASMAITQYDKDAIESMGLVKMDLLGSRALTALVDTLQASGLAHGTANGGDIAQSLEAIPLDDQSTFQLMSAGNTLGCFQLESPGMRPLLKWLCPRNLNDVAAAISLFRPGPLTGGFMETFMRRRLGQEPVTFPHPSMEAVLKDTYGVILYQEQFLQLAHTLAGLDLGEAEKLRKEIAKTQSPEERTRLGSRFVAGAIERGISQMQAEKVWEVVSGYTGFGFCRGHACSYALTAYRTAFAKAHYPAQYLAAVLNNQAGFYGPTVYIEEARRLGIELLPVDVNRSGAWCEVPTKARGPHGPHGSHTKHAIRLGLQFVKGLSERSIDALLSERRRGGQFRSLSDLMARVELSLSELTALVKVGACDRLHESAASTIPASMPEMPAIVRVEGMLGEPVGAIFEQVLNRKQMVWLLPMLFTARGSSAKWVRRAGADRSSVYLATEATGSDGMPLHVMMGNLVQHQQHTDNTPRVLGNETLHVHVPDLIDYTPREKLLLERQTLGFALSCNEMELYDDQLKDQGVVFSSQLARFPDREVTVAGVIAAGRRHMARDGNWMLFLTLQDRYGLIEVVLFSSAYEENKKVLAGGGLGPYLVRGKVQASGKGRGVGYQPPSDLRLVDSMAMKMHPVVIAHDVNSLSS
ncbi:MAG: DNA polymerase III subunit alpha [Chloroflexi bacterium]|nr:DNA polymerase III subunit alpha [Chloroflexota bacterium]